jgi:zinc transport system ATP-binding protein
LNKKIPTDTSLQVLYEGKVIYQNNGKWLYPLFDLEKYLSTTEGKHLPDRSQLEIRDKVIGKAAAFLIVRLGFKQVFGQIMSRLAEVVFERAGMRFEYGELVERIDCKTETLLVDVSDPEMAYRILRKRAGVK